ncbi:MAG: hypothetical protein QOG97_3641, partial [Acidimicrobiaceae bacterium]|jgi:hypothetical protein|nr:hypothetical protein [Acidimicrobiaceae bacterium]
VLSERTRHRLREQGFDASWLARHHRVHTP